MMRILYVCDGRSPIAMNWIAYFVERGDEIHLASTFNLPPHPEFASVTFIPVAFSQFKENQSQREREHKESILWKSSLVNLRTAVRRIVAPLTIQTAANKLASLITEIEPDLVHAMRIPFEGILASRALGSSLKIPLLVSVWGNDFTFHANATPWMRKATRLVLSRTDGLHTDCQRDRKLAKAWGFPGDHPALVIPGNGGVQTDQFYPPEVETDWRGRTVLNPRGIRAYIRNDAFFEAVPRILSQLPETRFLCPGMSGEQEAENLVDKYGIRSAVELLPRVSRHEMAELFRKSAVAVSPSMHDGTPNTLLEAMASGCYPVAGDLESIREWIEPGVNGSLIDPGDHEDLAEAVINALSHPEIQLKAAQRNISMIAERAEYQASMEHAREFYRTITR
ncbi:MAG: glycosyltransferase family 4 protein [Anaerolineales bacterium]